MKITIGSKNHRINNMHGNYVILEDNSTIFGPMGIDKGSKGKIVKSYIIHDSDGLNEKVDVLWLSGNKKGGITKRIFACRFRRLKKGKEC